MCSERFRSASSWTSPTSVVAGCTCRASATSTSCRRARPQANTDVNIAALRPYKGYGAIRVSENAGYSKYNSLQISADRRYTNGLKVGVAYTLGDSEDNASDKRNILWNTYSDTNYWGPSSFDRRHVASIYYIYDLPFWRDGGSVMKSALGGWQISGATFMRSGTPFSITRTDDIAGVGEGSNGQPVDLVGDIYANSNGKFSGGVVNGVATDQNFIFNPTAFASPKAGTFGNETRNLIRNPGDMQWDIAFFKNFALKGKSKVQFRTEIFNFLNHPNLSGPESNPTNANFGRSINKDGNRRDIQLALRFSLFSHRQHGPEEHRRTQTSERFLSFVCGVD